jgi:hypothetical protein
VAAQLELGNARAEMEARVHEKDEEFESTRRNQARALESMQASVEGESRARAELVRQKRKLEADVTELEVAVGVAQKGGAEAVKVGLFCVWFSVGLEFCAAIRGWTV